MESQLDGELSVGRQQELRPLPGHQLVLVQLVQEPPLDLPGLHSPVLVVQQETNRRDTYSWGLEAMSSPYCICRYMEYE